MQATVRILRSHDYCHFEVTLTKEITPDGHPSDYMLAVNELRKEAAVLVDEAVRQYKVAKKQEHAREPKEWQLDSLLRRIEAIKKSRRAN